MRRPPLGSKQVHARLAREFADGEPPTIESPESDNSADARLGMSERQVRHTVHPTRVDSPRLLSRPIVNLRLANSKRQLPRHRLARDDDYWHFRYLLAAFLTRRFARRLSIQEGGVVASRRREGSESRVDEGRDYFCFSDEECETCLATSSKKPRTRPPGPPGFHHMNSGFTSYPRSFHLPCGISMPVDLVQAVGELPPLGLLVVGRVGR